MTTAAAHKLGKHKALPNRRCSECFPELLTKKKDDRAVVAAHEAGMHDKKPVPATCAGCKKDAEESAVPAKPLPEPKVAKPPVVVEVAPKYDTREAWMLAAVEAMRPEFAAVEVELPQVRISVGWPGGRGNKQNVVGQCWMPEAVADGLPAIFVSPVQDKPLDVLETIRHELVHAAGNRGHRGPFARLAGQLGFVAPWKSTPASPALTEHLTALAEELGPWPHARVAKQTARLAVQSTRMIKVVCVNDGFTVRMARKWIEAGLPGCGICGDTMEEPA